MRLIADRTERLDRFLARVLPEFSRSQFARIAREDAVRVNGTPRSASHELKNGDTVELELPVPRAPHDLSPANIPLDVRYEDEFLLVINKPRGLAAHPAASLNEPSLVNALLARNHDLSQAGGAFRPGIVHRLDKDTTGVLVVAKTDSVHRSLAKQIQERGAFRRYFAVVAGHVEHERFTIRAPISRSKRNRLLMAVDPEGKHATTHLKRVCTVTEGTLLGASLQSGRTHQIRVHLQSVGHPILGDILYAPLQYRAWPLQLHAGFLSFEHPESKLRLAIYVPPPNDFIAREAANQAILEDF